MKIYGCIVIVLVCVIFMWYLYISGLFSWLDATWIARHALLIQQFVQSYPILASLLFLFCFILSVLFLLPTTIVLTISLGYFFGIFIGMVISIVGATLGGISVFLITRYLLFSYIEPIFKHRLRYIYQELQDYGAWYILMMQVLPATPSMLINVGAGLSPIAMRTFAWATACGLFPGTFLYVYLGTRLRNFSAVADILSWQWIMLLTLLAGFAFLPRLYMYYKGKPL